MSKTDCLDYLNACKRDDAQEVRKLLKKKNFPLTTFTDSNIPEQGLCAVIKNGNEQLFKYLYRSPTTKAVVPEVYKCLMTTIEKDQLKIVKEIISYSKFIEINEKVDCESKGTEFFIPIFDRAIISKSYNTLRYLSDLMKESENLSDTLILLYQRAALHTLSLDRKDRVALYYDAVWHIVTSHSSAFSSRIINALKEKESTEFVVKWFEQALQVKELNSQLRINPGKKNRVNKI